MGFSRRTSQDITNTGSGASLTITFPATATAGDLLVAIVQQNGTVTFSALASGWTQVTNSPATFDGGTATLATFAKIADGTETKFTATSSGTGAWQITSLAFTGALSPLGIDVAWSFKDGGISASNPATTNAISTTQGADLVLIVAGTTANNATWTWASPATVTVTSTTRLSVAQHIPAALLTSQSYSVTLAGTRLWGTAVIAFKATAVSASGSGSISLSGSGTATVKVPASGSGAISLSGSGTAKVKVSASGSGTLSLSGSGTGKVTVHASGSGAITLSGSGTAKTTVHGSGTGSISLSGSGSARVTVHASGSGAIALSGSGTGTVRVHASGSGAISLSGSGAAGIRATASGSGAITLSGSGTATSSTSPALAGCVVISWEACAAVISVSPDAAAIATRSPSAETAVVPLPLVVDAFPLAAVDVDAEECPC